MLHVFIVNFNTTQLTNVCIASILSKFKSMRYDITVIDNSNAVKFETQLKVNVIDNTHGQIVNFDSILATDVDWQFYRRVAYTDKSQHGSLKHSATIDWILKHSDDDVLLFDSDTILKRDIDFIDKNYATIAQVCYQEPLWKNRFLPFIQYFNVKRLKDINYYDPKRMAFTTPFDNAMKYDTGGSFYEDVIAHSLPFKEIKFTDYIEHLACGSWLSAQSSIRNSMKDYYGRH